MSLSALSGAPKIGTRASNGFEVDSLNAKHSRSIRHRIDVDYGVDPDYTASEEPERITAPSKVSLDFKRCYRDFRAARKVSAAGDVRERVTGP